MKNLSRSSILHVALLLLGATPLLAASPAAVADQPAQPITKAAPNVPYHLRQNEGAAQVIVSFTVNAQGVVTDARIRESSNFEFNNSTLAAIKQWTFAPATKDGKPVDAKVQQTFTFSVRDRAEVGDATRIASKKSSR